jgi:hypothetical protein
MTKEEFLKEQTNDVIKTFEKYGSYSPTFAVLHEDGTTKSFALALEQDNKDEFVIFMERICEDPKVIASVFTFEGWASEMAVKENKRPTECSDRETLISVIYNSRDNVQEVQTYLPDEKGKLQLMDSQDSVSGRFGNPFISSRCMLSDVEKLEAIDKFQRSICDSVIKVYQKYQLPDPYAFFLYDSITQIEYKRFIGQEWEDKDALEIMLKSFCGGKKSLAFILANQISDNEVSMILVSNEIQKIYSLKENPVTLGLELESEEDYVGKYADFFNRDNNSCLKTKAFDRNDLFNFSNQKN